jgi:3-hydroxyacyl-[acyl-carrier-protein] dehydratase
MAGADAWQRRNVLMSADTLNTGVTHADGRANGYEQAFCIDADHPALPGHFPGHPLVPGVILLEQVAIALRAWRGQHLARVLEAKFVAPLLPTEHAHVRLMLAAVAASALNENVVAERIRFEIFRDDTLLARGTVEGAA